MDVNYRPKGLGELKAKWGDFAGDLLEPVVLLAAGATKAQAAWAGMRGVFESRVLGPLGLVAGASLAFLATTRLLVGQWKAVGMAAAGSLERMTLQFRPLLGSLASAKARMAELSKFAVVTPFELPEIVEANKMLEVLTQGALSTAAGMTLVGNAASVAGTEFSDTARMVGRLYDGLMSGRPVGEATMRLQEMGVISGTVRNQLESMQAAGASGLEIWKVMEKQLSRNAGAMEEQSRSLEGLQSTWADTQRQMQGGFSSGFLEGEKAGVESSIAVMEAMSPAMAKLGAELGMYENAWAKFKLGVVKSVTSLDGFGETVVGAGKAVVWLAGVMAAASVSAIVVWGAGILKIAAGARAAANSAEYLTKTMGTQVSAATKLASVKKSLGAAMEANAAGLKGEMAGHLGAAGAGMKNLAVTNGLSTAVSVGNKVWMGMGVAVRFVGVQLRMMAVALLANPMVWFWAVVGAVAYALSSMAASAGAARAALEGYIKSTLALDSAMRKQIADIRTLVDLRRAESKILAELVSAYKAVDAAKTPEEKAAAQKRVDNLQGRLGDLPSTTRLEKSESELALDAGRRDGAKAAREFDRDAMAAKGPEEALKVSEERLDEIVKKRREAFDLANEEAAVEERSAAARQKGIAIEGEKAVLMERQGKLQNELAKLEGVVRPDGDTSGMIKYGGAEAFADVLAEKKAALEAVQAKIREMANMPEAQRLQELLASPSELQQIKAKLEVIGQLEAATSALADAEAAVAQNTDAGKAGGLGDAAGVASEDLARAKKLAGQAGVSGDHRDRQSLETRQIELGAERGANMDPVALRQAEKERADQARAVATARLDAEGAVDSLRLKGLEREERMLDIERQKLELKYQGEAIGRAEYERQGEILAAQAAAAQKEGVERRAELADALAGSKLRRAEESANLEGDPEKAAAMRRAAEALVDRREAVDAGRDAEGAAGTPAERAGYVAARVKEARDAREEDRRRRDEDRAADRARSEADQNSSVAAIDAERLRLSGQSRQGKLVAEQAAREQDELDRAEASKKYRDKGYDAATAGTMADTDIKTAQVERYLSSGMRGMGTVIASSLAKIGGGGAVVGVDPSVKELEVVQGLLKEILDQSKKTVTLEIAP